MSVVANKVEILGREESLIVEICQGSLTVQRMNTRKTYKSWVPLHVAIGSLEILWLNRLDAVLRGQGIALEKVLLRVKSKRGALPLPSKACGLGVLCSLWRAGGRGRNVARRDIFYSHDAERINVAGYNEITRVGKGRREYKRLRA